jgi:hypothetical protein
LPLQNKDGSINVTITDGSTKVPKQAPDGSLYVSLADGETVGVNGKDGSMRVTIVGNPAIVTDEMEVTIGDTTYTFTVTDGEITNIETA